LQHDTEQFRLLDGAFRDVFAELPSDADLRVSFRRFDWKRVLLYPVKYRLPDGVFSSLADSASEMYGEGHFFAREVEGDHERRFAAVCDFDDYRGYVEDIRTDAEHCIFSTDQNWGLYASSMGFAVAGGEDAFLERWQERLEEPWDIQEEDFLVGASHVFGASPKAPEWLRSAMIEVRGPLDAVQRLQRFFPQTR
jgi:hypothetical protein